MKHMQGLLLSKVKVLALAPLDVGAWCSTHGHAQRTFIRDCVVLVYRGLNLNNNTLGALWY